MAEIFVDSLYDAVLDCLKVIPILFLAYLLVAYLSHDHSHKFSRFLSKNKKTSVLYASFLGCIPQCGFSSVIADLYSQTKVSLGTLFAVFISTSDEAIPLMLTNSDSILYMLLMIGIKIVLALFWGYSIDAVVELVKKIKTKKTTSKETLEKTANKDLQSEEVQKGEMVESHTEQGLLEHSHKHHHTCGHIHTDECDEHCGHEKSCCADNIFLDAYYHTFEIAIYIFVATFILNFLISYADFAGVDVVTKILTDNIYIQILVASLIGLIPNCAASVLLVELFTANSLGFPALIAGLTACAGVGMVILWTKNRKKPLQNLLILIGQFVIGVLSGLFLTIFF